MFELTTRWVAQCLSGRAALPSEKAMNEWIEGFYEGLKAGGVPVRYTHEMSRTGVSTNMALIVDISCCLSFLLVMIFQYRRLL